MAIRAVRCVIALALPLASFADSRRERFVIGFEELLAFHEGGEQLFDLGRVQRVMRKLADHHDEFCGFFQLLGGKDSAPEIGTGDHRPVIGEKYGCDLAFQRPYHVAHGWIAWSDIGEKLHLADAHDDIRRDRRDAIIRVDLGKA